MPESMCLATTIGSKEMSQVTEEEARIQRDIHNHALRGDVVEVGGMDVAHNVEQNNPNSEKSIQKKREQEAELLRTVIEALDAYNDLVARLDAELEVLQGTIKDIEQKMSDNRFVWEFSTTILEEIDDVFCDFDDGGELDRSKALGMISDTGCEISEDATDAEIIALLQDIRFQHLQVVETLDVDHLLLEADHKRFKLRESQVLAAKDQLDKIGNDKTLNDNQRLKAIHNLNQEVGSKTLHTTATQIENKELASKADDAVFNSQRTNQIDEPVSVSSSLNTLNF
ncbi:hypothetical protein [Reichenbachiella sp.]|uniref:hypothetical protein n=1 Tax=Reichenbachiella sp. TaxID=2184521 RepID=UPI003297254A